jgi:sulfur-carrier protein
MRKITPRREALEIEDMTVTVRIPSLLSQYTGGLQIIEVRAGPIWGILESLEQCFPGLLDQVCDSEGELRTSYHIFVDGEDISYLSGVQTNVEEWAQVSIIRAIAGGAPP